jgi:hypothetical protein|tara:strand:+ start:468 stop:1163 length:696 start_codon:yes stop_codon:yes gene_type:complete
MGYSFYEIYTTSQRAFRGMGFPFGADEDAAYIIAWLELNRLNGVGIFKDTIEKIDHQYDGVLNLKEFVSEVDFKHKSILMKGSGLIDFLQSNIGQDQKILININNCSNGILFLPLLYKANKNVRFLKLVYKDSNSKTNIFKIYGNKIFHNIKKGFTKDNKLKIILSNEGISKINSSYKEITNDKKIQENLSESLRPNENDWGIISTIANRTFVPESKESRNKGAGGGDAND